MNFVKENLDQRDIVLADTGQALSDDSGPGKRDGSRQFARDADGFRRKKLSRNEQFEGSNSKADSPSGMQNFHSPFGAHAPASKNGIRNNFKRTAQNNNNEYYSGARGGQYENMSDEGSQNAFGDRPGRAYDGSSMDIQNNHESDMNITRTVPQKKTKYNSLDRGENETVGISPVVMKKKANVHLQPMSHKKAPIMTTTGQMKLGSLGGAGSDMGGISHSESNPILNAPIINDRVKLEKLSHIPSVKSNLMSNDNMS